MVLTPSLYRLLARSSWQFYKRHPAQLLLSILGIVLGVGIVTAVLITNHSSQRAFALSSEALYGRTTHQLTGANGIDQADYVTLLKRFPAVPMAPIIEGHVAIGTQVFSLLGLDPFAEAAFARMRRSGSSDSSLCSGHTEYRRHNLEIVELNPFLDERGRTASLMVDLTASLLGRRVFDRPTQSYQAHAGEYGDAP